MGGRRHSSAQWVVTLWLCSLANDNSKPLYTLGARWFESLMLTLGTKWYYAEPPRVFTAEGLYGG